MSRSEQEACTGPQAETMGRLVPAHSRPGQLEGATPDPNGHRSVLTENVHNGTVGRSITVDEQYRPVVLVTFHRSPTDEEFTAYLDHMSELLEGDRRYAVILDVRQAGDSSRHQQRLQADWIKTNRTRLKATSCGTAFVMTSAVTRFILSAVFLIQRPPNDYVVVASMHEALEWTRSKLTSEGLTKPPSIAALR